jgi:hypothetical protein
MPSESQNDPLLTFRNLRADQQAEHYYSVYMVLLDLAAARLRSVLAANSEARTAQVGGTALASW